MNENFRAKTESKCGQNSIQSHFASNSSLYIMQMRVISHKTPHYLHRKNAHNPSTKESALCITNNQPIQAVLPLKIVLSETFKRLVIKPTNSRLADRISASQKSPCRNVPLASQSSPQHGEMRPRSMHSPRVDH